MNYISSVLFLCCTPTENRTRIKGLGNLRSIHLTMGVRLFTKRNDAVCCFNNGDLHLNINEMLLQLNLFA